MNRSAVREKQRANRYGWLFSLNASLHRHQRTSASDIVISQWLVGQRVDVSIWDDGRVILGVGLSVPLVKRFSVVL